MTPLSVSGTWNVTINVFWFDVSIKSYLNYGRNKNEKSTKVFGTQNCMTSFMDDSLDETQIMTTFKLGIMMGKS